MRVGCRRIVPTIVVAVLLAAPADSRDLASRASLSGMAAVGQLIVSVTGRSKGDEDALRLLIERRLENAGISIDSGLASRLVATVTGSRDTSSSGLRYFTYAIKLSLQEPVQSQRAPRTTFRGVTW